MHFLKFGSSSVRVWWLWFEFELSWKKSKSSILIVYFRICSFTRTYQQLKKRSKLACLWGQKKESVSRPIDSSANSSALTIKFNLRWRRSSRSSLRSLGSWCSSWKKKRERPRRNSSGYFYYIALLASTQCAKGTSLKICIMSEGSHFVLRSVLLL